MIKYLFYIALFFSFSFLHAQGSLKLTLVDQSENPIEYANVRLFSPTDSTVATGGYSNVEGSVFIEDIPYGSYYIKITFFGFQDAFIDQVLFSKNSRKKQLGEIQLQKIQSQDFEEVVIEGEKNLMESSIDKRTYNVSEDMTTLGGGLTEVLNNIPSVEVDNDGNVSLRGNGSVTILIDGRPSAMSSGDGALDGIPASAIERIELVTNPSAKYDPDGTAGIINIVLKKKKLRGVNANVSLTAASEDLYNGNVGFNIRNEKVNFYTSYSMRYREGDRNNFNERYSYYNDTVELLDQDRLGTDFRRSHTGKIGADFFLHENHVVGVSASGTYNDRIRRGKQTNYLSYNDETFQYWDRNVYDPRNRQSVDLNTNYKWDFEEDKGDFIFAGTYSTSLEEATGRFREYYYNPDGTRADEFYRFQNQERNEQRSAFTLSADVVRNISKTMKIDAGLKMISNRQEESNYLEYYDTITDDVIPDPNVNNTLAFDEDIYSAYAIYGHQPFKKFKYQVGVRLEQALTEPRLVNSGETFENDYFSFFPSGHLVYGNDTMGEIFMSYSRRINRPRSRQLNPFPIYSDPLNLRQGNPELQPEYINSYEVGYEKFWGKLSLTNTIYFKQTVDRIQRIRRFFDDGRSVTTYANVDESYDVGLEIIGMYNPFSWMRNTVSFNVFESRLSAEIDGTQLSNRGVSWDVKLNTSISLLDKTTAIQINAQYIAPRYTVQGFYQRNPGIDVGFTRTLLDKKMTLGVRLTDVFNQKGFYFEINDDTVSQSTVYKWTTRRLYLSLSYKFNNINTKEEKLRKKIEDAQTE
jgi:outer membrane receptor protein involved in Fe transport